MDWAILLEYAWVLLVVIGLEGILAADNAVVMAVMVKHLPKEQQKKALFYGLVGAFFFRIGSLFLISLLVDMWQIQAIGAVYLLYIMINYMVKHYLLKPKVEGIKERKQSGFWMTVFKVEVADLAFAVDSMLAAVALAVTLPAVGSFNIGGINGGQFIVMFLGGFIGLIIMRFAATQFVVLLNKRPSLETAAFLIVGWVGVKLAVMTLAHPGVGIIDHHFPESGTWKLIFWGVLVAIVVIGFLVSGKDIKANKQINQDI